MSRKGHRKLAKKRNAQREQRRKKPVALAYHGNKYKSDELVKLLFHTEVGIYESFVMTDRRLTDHQVRSTLEDLILGIRRGSISVPPPEKEADEVEVETDNDMVAWSIRRNWRYYFEKNDYPGRDKLVGVLRTILGSIEVWGNISRKSQGYLRYLEGFMKAAGVTVDKVSPDFDGFPPDEEPEDEDLLAIGQAWLQDGESEAATLFRALAEEMISSGEAQEVAETCQQLMGEINDREAIAELSALSLRAQAAIPPPRGRFRNLLGRLIGR